MATNKHRQDCSPWLTNTSREPAEPSATTKRLRANPPRDETAAEAPPPLPLDLLLEILSRSDVETIVRSAAVSRTLRGAVLDEGFRRRLALRAAANGGFDSALLRGISYRLEEWKVGRDERVVQSLPSSDDRLLIRFDASLRFTPVASRDGLVVLRRRVYSTVDELIVCDSVTGHTIVLPPMAITSYYPHVLLAVDYDGGGGDSGRSFEVLVADRNLQTQTYSSRDGKWSAVVPAAANFPLHRPPCSPVEVSHPVVIGRTVHWLRYPETYLDKKKLQIVALDVDAAQATVIELPQGCMGRMTGAKNMKSLMLVVSSDGELGLVVSETSAISMWTLSASSSSGGSSSPARWSRRVVMPMPNWGEYGSIETRGFGERSGTVILYMCKVGLVHLNVATGESVVVLHRNDAQMTYISQVCLHEINLAALLRSMKLNL